MSKENLELLAHSPFGPSAADIWINCPASIMLQEGIPDSESQYAAEGTAAHMLSEWARAENKPPSAWRGAVIEFPKRNPKEKWEFTVTEEMIDAVTDFVDNVNAYPPQGLTGQSFFEKRVHYYDWVTDGFGTADDIRIWIDESGAGICRITDLKYGKGVHVDVEDNTQLKMYALGVYEVYGFLYEIEKFILVVHQPRINNVSEWEISTEDLLDWADTIVRPAAQEARSDTPSIKAGEHCRWCRARFTCKARAAHVLNLIEFDKFDIRKDKIMLDPMEIAELLPHAGQVTSFFKDLEAKALEMVQSRQNVGGYKLVRGRASRKWDDESKVEKAMARLKISADVRYKPRELITPAQAEKVLGKDHPLLQAPEQKGGHVVWSSGSPTLVPGTDKRPSIIQDIEFEDITNEKAGGITFDNIE